MLCRMLAHTGTGLQPHSTVASPAPPEGQAVLSGRTRALEACLHVCIPIIPFGGILGQSQEVAPRTIQAKTSECAARPQQSWTPRPTGAFDINESGASCEDRWPFLCLR